VADRQPSQSKEGLIMRTVTRAKTYRRHTVARDGSVDTVFSLKFTADNAKEAGSGLDEDSLPFAAALGLMLRWNQRAQRGIGFPKHFYTLETWA
jgi:hypothetical protein